MAKVAVESMESLYEQKLTHLNKIAELTNSQILLMEADDMEGLLDNLEKRQLSVDAVNALDARIEGGKGKTGRAAADAQIEKYRQKVKTLLGIIEQQDRANELMATAKLESYKGLVRKNNENRKTLDQYGRPPVSTDGVYFDTKK